MNFNYSYRAFLITSLLFGILFLTLWSIKISAEIPEEIITTPVEYIETEPEPDVEQLLSANVNSIIETNRAYNEAEKFIKESEKERLENPLAQENTNASKQDPSAINNETAKALEEAKKRMDENAAKLNELNKNAKKSKNNGFSKRTTISYKLKSRQAISLKNPVYTCESGGTIVLDIEVDSYGNILKANYNKNASTSTNGCLIESAIEYAEKAQFSTSALISQKGTITYNFPGQK